MSLRLLQGADPSVARRLLPLLGYGACLGGAVLLLAALAASIGAAARRVPFAAGMPGAAAGFVLYVALVKTAGGLLWRSGGAVRWGALLGSAAVSVLCAWLISRWFAARPHLVERHRRVFAPGRVAALSLAGMAAAAGIGFFATSSITEPAAPGAASAGRQGRPDIILVLVDTLRADSVSALGGPAGSTPNVDALAGSGVRFLHAVSPSPWTLPSVASLLSASDPRSNGFGDFSSAIPESVTTLPERLGAAGYQCVAIVGNPLVSIERGFSQGFELFDVHNYSPESRLLFASAFSETLRLTGALGHLDRGKNPIPWFDPSRPPFLDTRLSFYVHDEVLNDRLFRYGAPDPERPLFLYMHYIAPHSPYLDHPYRLLKTMPVKAPENRDLMIGLYRAEVHYMDSVLGDLLARLRDAGRLDDAVIAFVADHGEEFLEHGRWEHGHNLFEESIHVPVVLSGDGLARRVPGFRPGSAVERSIELTDVAPTLAALAGAPIPPARDGGRDLLPLLGGAAEAYPSRPIYSELVSRYLNEKDDYRAVQQDGLKLIRHRRPEGELISEEAYDLRGDPSEKTPLTDWPEALRSLRAVLEDAEKAAIRHTGEGLSDEELRKMRALGYVQ